MAQYKIIFTGPEGAGKTSAIQAIGDVPSMEANASADGNNQAKTSAQPSACDFGVISLSDDDQFHLYEIHGQEHLDVIRVMLDSGGIGIVLLLNNCKADPFKDLWLYWDAFQRFLPGTSIAIGITHMDISNTPTIADYHAQLQVSDIKPPIFSVDTRVQKDVFLLVQALLCSNDIGY